MSDVTSELRRFEDALKAGRRRAAYEAARAAWRVCRTPELAALVERAAQRFTDVELSAKTQKKRMEAWLERARRREPYESRKLLEALGETARAHRGSVVAACLDELVGEADDPSLTMPACALAGVPGGSVAMGSWGKVLTRLFTIVEKSGDPRGVDALEALAADAAANPETRGPSTSADLVERIPKAVARLRKRLPSQTPAHDAEARERVRDALALLEGDLPEPADEPQAAPLPDEELCAAVLANPDDDATRAVWADALLQRGDPRGELIALQRAGTAAAQKAAARIVKAHWRAWLGPLAPAVVPSTVEFDRGLLDACTTDVRRKIVADTIFDHPGWATVRRLRFAGYGRLTAVMQRLEEAVDVPEPGLEALATVALPRLRVLSVKPSPTRGADDGLSGGEPVGRGLAALARAQGLPALRSLTLAFADREWNGGNFRDRGADDYAWLFAAPFGAKLEDLEVGGDWRSWREIALVNWVELLRARGPAIRRFAVREPSARLEISLASGTGKIEFTSDPTWHEGGLAPWADGARIAAERLLTRAGLRMAT